MKTTKNTFLIFVFLLASVATNGQQIYLEAGFGDAFFEDYVNDLGENTLDDTYSKAKSPFIEGGVRFDIYKERIKLVLGANYSTYTVNTAFTSGNIKIPTTYDLSYISLKYGLNFSLLEWNQFKLQVHFHLSHDWLTAGTNKYREQVIDLYKEKTLDRTLLRFHRGIALEYEISYNIAAYLNYGRANSIKEPKTDSTVNESYSFETNSVSLGILFNILEVSKSKEKKQKRSNRAWDKRQKFKL